MHIPILAAAAIAATFTTLGVMTVRVALLTTMVKALLPIAIGLAIYILWMRYKA